MIYTIIYLRMIIFTMINYIVKKIFIYEYIIQKISNKGKNVLTKFLRTLSNLTQKLLKNKINLNLNKN